MERTMPGTIARPAPVNTPRIVAYQYRARTYPWAARRLRAAEAVHGVPVSAVFRPPGRPRIDGRCSQCGYPLTSVGHSIECGEPS